MPDRNAVPSRAATQERIARALFAHDHATYRYDGAFAGEIADAYMEAAAVVLDELDLEPLEDE